MAELPEGTILIEIGANRWNPDDYRYTPAQAWIERHQAVGEYEAKGLWRRFGREWLFESKPRGRQHGRAIGPYTPSGLRALTASQETRDESYADRRSDFLHRRERVLPGWVGPEPIRRHEEWSVT